jgi:hypothetical protein
MGAFSRPKGPDWPPAAHLSALWATMGGRRGREKAPIRDSQSDLKRPLGRT